MTTDRVTKQITEAPPRILSRNETHDLGMIIKDRAKVLRAHAEEQAAACLADFEKNCRPSMPGIRTRLGSKAAEQAEAAAAAAQEIVAERCAELGIPKTFAPSISVRGKAAARIH